MNQQTLSPADSRGNMAVLTKPIDEVKYPSRRKRKGTTTIASFCLPYDWNIDKFYSMEFREPVIIPAGAIVELRVTMPKKRG